MKKIIIPIVIIVIISAGFLTWYFFSQKQPEKYTGPVEKNGIIKSASELDYPPFSIVTPKGEADGFSVELLRAALKAVNLDVTFYVAPWDQIKQDLADGKIQVLPVVGRTPEREPIYDFTEPYLTFYGAIFVRTGDTRIKIEKDLLDKEVVVMKGDNAEEYARRENISSRIVTIDTYEEAFTQLSQGKYDAVVAQQRMGITLLKNLGIKNVVAVDYRLDKFRQDFTFAVKEGDANLLSELNKGLSIVMQDGTFDKLKIKWFAEPEETLNYPLLIGLIVLLALVMVLVGGYLIRRKYKEMS
jgi:ABC-type amino acid transport substrate-binding protein